MIPFRFLLMICLITAFDCELLYCSQQVVTKSELAKMRSEHVEKFKKNGIQNIIGDYADRVVLIYSVSNEADEDNLIYNTSARQRLKKHHYKTGVTSGVLLSQDGIICTTNTGIINADTFIISINSELRPRVNDSKITIGKNDYKAELIKSFPELNLAFLRINLRNKNTFHYAQLGSDAPLVGGKDRILLNNSVIIGKAKGENFVNSLQPANSKNNFSVFAAGIERLSYQTENDRSVLIARNPITNPAVIAETAGGAIFNMDGKLIGIADPQTDNFGNVNQTVIPVSTVKKALNIAVPGMLKIADNKFIGIEVMKSKNFNLSKTMRKILKLSPSVKKIGVTVKSIELNSLADEAGILPGDVILTYNSEPVTSPENLRNFEKLSLNGETVTIKILRKGSLIDFEIYK